MFNYNWYLSDGFPAKGIKKNNLKVFSTFACGGGSSMGYKLAGYDVIGANDIDKQMETVYKENLNPRFYFKVPIKKLLEIKLPEELYNLDILDGSPPCSTFSMAGSREKVWGKNKKFREGQTKQVLDDLFFDFINLAKRLKPKIIVAENVKGMLMGNAKGYLVEIHKRFENIDYNVQLFCLNASTMGVPQKRERIFFICSRKDLDLHKIELRFNEKLILLKDIYNGENGKKRKGKVADIWDRAKEGETFNSIVGTYFSKRKLAFNKVLPTLTAHCSSDLFMPNKKATIAKELIIKGGSFPTDYNFLNIDEGYLIGMSVPPIMMAQIANQVYIQLLSKL